MINGVKQVDLPICTTISTTLWLLYLVLHFNYQPSNPKCFTYCSQAQHEHVWARVRWMTTVHTHELSIKVRALSSDHDRVDLSALTLLSLEALAEYFLPSFAHMLRTMLFFIILLLGTLANEKKRWSDIPYIGLQMEIR